METIKSIINAEHYEEANIQGKTLMISINNTYKSKSIYEATRGSWREKLAKVNEAELVLSTVKGFIVGAFISERWYEVDVDGKTRVAFEGIEAPDFIKNQYVGKRVPLEYRRQGHASPVKYSWKPDNEKTSSKNKEDILGTKDIDSDETKFFVLNIKGTGSECTYGIVTNDEDKSKLQALAKTEELELENYFDEGEILHHEYTQILRVYGPSTEEAIISLTAYEDEEALELKEEIFCDEDIDSLPLHIFQYSNPDPMSDAFNHEKYKDSLQFGGYKTEKRINYPAFISIGKDEEFELDNVFIGYMSLEDTLTEDTLVHTVLYIRPEVSQRIFVLHTDNDDLTDWSQEDVAEILSEVYENLDDMHPELKNILNECECEVGDIEGKGEIEESFVQLCDAEDNLIFEKTY